MKLYYSPNACSLAPHIVARELGLAIDLERVNLPAHKTEHGEDFYAVNPLGYVPALRLDSGELMTEAQVIVRYLADQKPQAKLAPELGTLERYRLEEWLNIISTELHKTIGKLFDQKAPEEVKEAARAIVAKRLGFFDQRLGVSPYVAGAEYSVADAYLFTILRWTAIVKIDLAPWPNIRAFMEKVGARPAVLAALEAEGKAH